MADFSPLDRNPESLTEHIGFLESLRDEIHYAAEAKRQQLVLQYSNETLAKMVRGIKWTEASEKLATLTDIPDEMRATVNQILQRELTVSTVEQIDQLLTPVVSELRDTLERSRLPELVSKTPADSPPTTIPKGRKPRSQKKADDETKKRETKLVADWVRARESGVYKGVFAKQNEMTVKELDKLLNRVAKRNSRLDK